MLRLTRFTPLTLILGLAACPRDPGDGSGGSDSTGATATTTTSATTVVASDGSTSATTAPTTGDPTSAGTTDDPTGGACSLPPLHEEVIEALGFNVFGSSYEAQPGETLSLAVGAIECCYVKQPVEACVVYSVTPVEGASIDAAGELTIAADAAPGTTFTVTADVEAGRAVLTTEVYVYTPETNPLVGIWHEVAQLPCGGGPEVAPEQSIGELWFRASGEALVTWQPFEIYVDYWSDYTYDLNTGALEIVPSGGNYVPADVEGAGTFMIEDDQLVLADMWLGSPQGAMQPANCGHRFAR